MSQQELNEAVVRATGESFAVIDQHGFHRSGTAAFHGQSGIYEAGKYARHADCDILWLIVGNDLPKLMPI